jgi:hypothetical protein
MLTALVTGVFGTLMILLVCGTAVSIYGMNIADRNFGQLLVTGEDVLDSLPEWVDSLPPVAEMLNDSRTPSYRAQLEASVAPARHEDAALTTIRVKNTGSETVTLLTARIVYSDEKGVPLAERRAFIATPLTIDEDEWRGPLLPGSDRKFVIRAPRTENDLIPSLEITDVRVWNGPVQPASAPQTARP